MISALGDAKGTKQGNFVLLDHETFEVGPAGARLRLGSRARARASL